MKPFLIRWFVTTLAVLAADAIFPGINAPDFTTLLGASLLLGIVNALVRPVLLLLSFPLIIVSLGFFILVINALLLKMVGGIVPGFVVEGWWTAFFGAIVISIASWVLSAFFKDSTGKVQILTHHSQMKQAQGRVIDG